MAHHAKRYNSNDLADLASRRGRRFRTSENGNFYYPNCTTPELEELEKLYGRRGYTVTKQLNFDGRTWFVSVELPVSNHLPRTPRCYRQRIWR